MQVIIINYMNKTALYVTGLVAVVMTAGALYTASISNPRANTAALTDGSKVSITSIESARGLAAIFSANGRVITWATSGFKVGEPVDINLIRKTSDSPVAYELVRKIADNTKNDGKYTWAPKEGELETGLFIEVTCSGKESTAGCEVETSPLSVK